jgi:hypothetical protein
MYLLLHLAAPPLC